MKTGDSLIGGSLNPSSAAVYAQYLVRTLEAYQADGVPINTLTVQDEPTFSPGDYPGMTLTEPAEAGFVAQDLGPALRSAGLTTAVLGYDDDWNNTSYPTALLANRAAAPYLAGVAFHCYTGNVSAQVSVHDHAPHAAIWLSECTGGPHTGGCTDCRGVLTVDPTAGTVTPNVEYWTLAQASLAAQPGAVRIASNTFGNGNLESTAFRNPDDTDALLVVNSGTTPRSLQIRDGSLSTPVSLPGGAVATFSW
jgi:glucosylceramidase